MSNKLPYHQNKQINKQLNDLTRKLTDQEKLTAQVNYSLFYYLL